MASDVIAERTFTVDGRELSCRFFRPEEDDGSYFCRYEIDWPEQRRSRRAGGVDEVQAILLAMQLAHSELLAARENDGRAIAWLNDRSLGLPIASSIRDWDPDNRF
jgi:hypothetical protein